MTGTRRKLNFMVEQVISAIEDLWLMHNTEAQCTLEGRGRGFNLSCLALKIEIFTLSLVIL